MSILISSLYPLVLDTSIADQSTGTMLVVGGGASAGHTFAHKEISAALLKFQKLIGTANSQDSSSLVYKVNQLTSGASGATGTGSITGSGTLSLVGDVSVPLEGQFYGYNNSVRGWSYVSWSDLSDTPIIFRPSPHHTTHYASGTDPIPIDSLAAAGDTTNLDASALSHGLLLKLANTGTQFLRDDGTWQTVAGGGGGGSSTGADSLTGTTTITLVNDSPTPGNNKLYGTTSGGTLGYRSISSLPVDYASLTGTPSIPTVGTLTTSDSLAGGGAMTGNLTLTLVNDTPTPSADTYYGYQAGNRGFFQIPYASLSGLPTLPSVLTSTAGGLTPSVTPNTATQVLLGSGVWGTLAYSALSGTPTLGTAASKNIPASGNASGTEVVYGSDTRLTDSRTPAAHAASHLSGGSDAIALDALGACTDITTLNASTTAHGLLKKLDNTASHYLDGTGAWSIPAGGSGSTGADSITGTTTLTLVGDVVTPSADTYYGYHGGARGFFQIPYSTLSSLPTLPVALTTTVGGLTPNVTPNDATKVLRGDAAWGTLAYTSLSGTPTLPVALTSTVGGLTPAVTPNDATKVLLGSGVWGALAYSSLTSPPSIPTVGTLTTSNSITGGGAMTGNLTVTLVGDVATPSADTYYGYHGAARGFFQIPYSTLSGLPTLPVALTSTVGGLTPAVTPNSASQVLLGTGVWGTLAYSALSGLPTLPVALTSTVGGLTPSVTPNDSTKVLRGDGAWGTLAYTSLSGTPTQPVALTSTVGGLTPTVTPNDATKVLRGDGAWGTLAYTSLSGTPTQPVALTSTVGGLTPNVTPNSAAQVLLGSGVWGTLAYSALSSPPTLGTSAAKNIPASGNAAVGEVVYGTDTRLADTRTPSAHAPSHKSGGSDSIALDTLAVPTDITTLNSTSTQHGLLVKVSGTATDFVGGDNACHAHSTVALDTLGACTDITTRNAASTQHGLLAKTSGTATDFVGGDNACHAHSTIALDTLGVTTDITTLNASTSAHGLLPKLDNVSTHFLNGQGGWTTPAGGGNPYITTSSSFTVPAINTTVNVTVAATTDMLTGQVHTITDGTRFMVGAITGIASLVVTYNNQGGAGAVSGSMGAGHVYMAASNNNIDNNTAHFLNGANNFVTPPTVTTSAPGYVPTAPNNTYQVLRGDGTWSASALVAVTNGTFTIPAVGTPLAITILAASWPAVGQTVFISDTTHFGFYEITTVGSTTSITIINRGYNGNTVSGTTMSTNSPVILYAPGMATSTQPGFIAATDVQVFTATGAGTWTKPTAGTPMWTEINCIGGGGGGGSGCYNTSSVATGGGAGGAGANYSFTRIRASLLGSTVSLNVGAGCPGGVAMTVAGTTGNNGTAPVAATNDSWFGTSISAAICYASAGSSGTGGNTTTAVAGGTAGANGLYSGTVGGVGGKGAATASAPGTGVAQTISNATGGGAGGGGGGGYCVITTPVATVGAAGAPGPLANGKVGGGAAGAVSAAGTAGSGATFGAHLPGDGGGGGGSTITAGGGGATIKGGAGGLYGGGGGGGGAALSPTVTAGSGPGGAGANGVILVVTYF